MGPRKLPVPKCGAGLNARALTMVLLAAGLHRTVENILPIQGRRQRYKIQGVVVAVLRQTSTSRGNMWIAGTNCKQLALFDHGFDALHEEGIAGSQPWQDSPLKPRESSLFGTNGIAFT